MANGNVALQRVERGLREDLRGDGGEWGQGGRSKGGDSTHLLYETEALVEGNLALVGSDHQAGALLAAVKQRKSGLHRMPNRQNAPVLQRGHGQQRQARHIHLLLRHRAARRVSRKDIGAGN